MADDGEMLYARVVPDKSDSDRPESPHRKSNFANWDVRPKVDIQN